MNRIVGILGGMGPLATADLYRKIILATPAATDQEHLHVIIDADPAVPDRLAALQGRGPDPTPWLVRGARRLEAAGAAFIAVPCNTAHAFLPAVRTQVGIPILDMIGETVERVATAYPEVQRVGLLATSGTIESRLYHDALARRGLVAIVPDQATQTAYVDTAIYRVKAGDLSDQTGRLLATAAAKTRALGAGVLLAACTEIPLALDQAMVAAPLLDPTAILADAVVREARAAAAVAA